MPAPVEALGQTDRSGGYIAVVRSITVPGRSSCIVQALEDLPTTVCGDGSQTRCFCSVDNLIDPFVCLMTSADAFLGPPDLGIPVEFTNRQLTEQPIEPIGC